MINRINGVIKKVLLGWFLLTYFMSIAYIFWHQVDSGVQSDYWVACFFNPVYAWNNSVISPYFYVYIFASYFFVKPLWNPFLKNLLNISVFEFLLVNSGVIQVILTIIFWFTYLEYHCLNPTDINIWLLFYLLYGIMMIPNMVRIRGLD